ncbi:MAG TPA: CotH kinase family protein [Saprospiraceae bacterium]|nr:CotH kinase family protein [Saprospiraceae bacterium]
MLDHSYLRHFCLFVPGLIIVFLATGGKLGAQDLYDANVIQKIEIHFNQSNWNALMQAEKNGDENYILAAWCKVNGVQFDSVGVKYKGNSSYRATNKKNPLHIELDYVKDQTYNGQGDIKLSNVYQDPSFVREAVSYYILQNYMDCPKANFANVYINDQLYGLYTNVESINKRFLSNVFDSKNNTFVKCNPKQVQQYLPNLAYKGVDTTLYYGHYEMKSDAGWKELMHLCDTLVNHTEAIEEILDVDKALWMLAFNVVMVNLDSYSGSFAQNYYLYRDNNDRFASLVWDLNMSFGGFPNMGGGGGATLDILYNANNSARPLIQKLLSNATYKRKYMAHIRTLSKEFFENGLYLEEAGRLRTLIDAAVQADPYKFYTYTQFQNAMTTDISAGGGGGGPLMSTPGVQKLMTARMTYFASNADYKKIPPQVNEINKIDQGLQGVRIEALLSGQSGVSLAYRYQKLERFVQVEMKDDGTNGDQKAGDLIYTATVPYKDGGAQYYIYAENNDAGIFYPQRAEHEFYTLTFTNNQLAIPAGSVVVNEFLASNKTVNTNSEGKYEDWIELYNTTGADINLGGIYLTDNPDSPTKWSFPAGTIIRAGGYLTVWADEDSKIEEGLHTNFKLSADGEEIRLLNIDGTVVDEYSYGVQTADVSMGRCTNGSGTFVMMVPSFGASNQCATGTEEEVAASVSMIVPNPAYQGFTIQSAAEVTSLKIYDLSGKTLYEGTGPTVTEVFAPGLYVVEINRGSQRLRLVQL